MPVRQQRLCGAVGQQSAAAAERAVAVVDGAGVPVAAVTEDVGALLAVQGLGEPVQQPCGDGGVRRVHGAELARLGPDAVLVVEGEEEEVRRHVLERHLLGEAGVRHRV